MAENTPWQLKPLAPELHDKALLLLQSKGHVALREVEKLMGWESSFSMTNRVMARQLGIPEERLRYLIWRHHLSEKEKEQRLAERAAKSVVLSAHTSHKLGFHIALPTSWQVSLDTFEWSKVSQEWLVHVLHSKSADEPTSLRWRTRTTFNESGEQLPQDLKELAQEEFEERLAHAERGAAMEQMATGLFQAEPRDGKDSAFIEVTKFRFDRPLTALELYQRDKPDPADVTWGSRPSKGMVVDGLLGVVYYFAPGCRLGEAIQESAVYFNVYLADGHEGWILSCQCRYGEPYFKTFIKYKPIFRRIIGSFRRLP